MRQLSDIHQSIQEIERERDQMMAAIESQLERVYNANMRSDDSDIDSRPSSPGSCYSSVSGVGRPRADTVGTQFSQASATTTRPLAKRSVIDDATTSHSRKRLSVQTTTTTMDDRMIIKSKEMSDRMATIQQKVSRPLAIRWGPLADSMLQSARVGIASSLRSPSGVLVPRV
jgi:hypothetical protein